VEWSRHPILKQDQSFKRHPPTNPGYALNKSG
jgi:hypothetical protein